VFADLEISLGIVCDRKVERLDAGLW